MTALAIPTLSSHQLSLALDLLEFRDFAPTASLRQLGDFEVQGEFTKAQSKALRILLKTLDDTDAARALRESCDGDEESLVLLRERIVHEARAAYVR